MPDDFAIFAGSILVALAALFGAGALVAGWKVGLAVVLIVVALLAAFVAFVAFVVPPQR